jgi:hypothetical protein
MVNNGNYSLFGGVLETKNVQKELTNKSLRVVFQVSCAGRKRSVSFVVLHKKFVTCFPFVYHLLNSIYILEHDTAPFLILKYG